MDTRSFAVGFNAGAIRFFALGAACLFAGGAFADWTWNGGNNADISDPANWTGTDGAYLFPASASGLYLSQNWTCATNMHLTADGTTFSFDLGADKTITFSDFQYFFYSKNSTVEFLSGTIVNTTKEMNLLSDQTWGRQNGGNTFRLKGANTFLDARAGAIFSYHGSGSTFEICDGARFNGAFRYGNTNPTNQKLYIHDGGAFTNTASKHETPAGAIEVLVSNAIFSAASVNFKGSGQSFKATGGSTINSTGWFTFGNSSGSSGNSMEVSGGSSLSAQLLNFGAAESALNDILITGEGTEVDAQYGLYLGGRDSSGLSNTVTVADGALMKITKSQSGYQNMVIGHDGGWNKLVVKSGAVVTNEATASPRLGWYSSNNSIEIDGGRINVGRGIIVGDDAGANSNKISVANGGILRSGAYYCVFRVGGSGGCYNELEIGDDGLVEIMYYKDWAGRYGNGTDNSYVGYGDGASCNVIRVLEGGVLRCPWSWGTDITWAPTKLNLGFDRNTCSNRLEVLGGAVKIGRIYVGGTNETSVANALVVSNGTVYTKCLYVSQDTTLPDGTPFTAPNSVVVKGTNSVVKTNAELIFYNKSELVLDLADGAFVGIPLQATVGTLEFKEGSTIDIDHARAVSRMGGATMVIARRTDGAITFADGLLDSWNASLHSKAKTIRCNLYTENSGKDLVLKVHNAGLVLVVR